MRKFVVILVLIICVLNCGCYGLRKKFVRKRRTPKEAPVYIDFQQYPEKFTKQAYVDYYLFVRGWLDELIGACEKNDSFKRKKRAIDEAIMNIEQIISAFNSDGKNAIYPIYEELRAIQKDIEQQPNMSQVKCNDIIRQTQNVKRRFEKEFNYTDAEKWLN